MSPVAILSVSSPVFSSCVKPDILLATKPDILCATNKNEDRVVKQLGMDYLHIPVDFDRPTLADFQIFAQALGKKNSTKTLVHCQVNFRASVFVFLYRVVIEGVPIIDAKKDLDSVWTPNQDWFKFIRSALKSYKLSHKCEACDWGEHEFIKE